MAQRKTTLSEADKQQFMEMWQALGEEALDSLEGFVLENDDLQFEGDDSLWCPGYGSDEGPMAHLKRGTGRAMSYECLTLTWEGWVFRDR